MGNQKPQMKKRTDNKNCQMKNEKVQTMICKSLHRKQIDQAMWTQVLYCSIYHLLNYCFSKEWFVNNIYK